MSGNDLIETNSGCNQPKEVGYLTVADGDDEKGRSLDLRLYIVFTSAHWAATTLPRSPSADDTWTGNIMGSCMGHTQDERSWRTGHLHLRTD